MPNLSDVADDVPIREVGKALIGDTTNYQNQALLATAFAGTDGVPRDDTVVCAAGGRAVDRTYAELRNLLEVYRANLGVTPLAGMVAGFNAQGLMEAVETLLTDFSLSKYEAGRIPRANGVAYVDARGGLFFPTSGAPSASVGYDGDLAVDPSAGTFYVKGWTTAGTWTQVASLGGGVSPQTLIVKTDATPLTLATVVPVQWSDADAAYSGTAWTYAGTSGDYYWSPPVAGLYEVECGLTLIKSTTGRADFRMIGYWDETGGGSFAGWPNTPESGGNVGDDTDANASEGFCVVSDFLQLTADSRIKIQVLAQSANQSVKADNGYLKAKRIA